MKQPYEQDTTQYDNITRFTDLFSNQIIKAKVINIHDGDTVTVTFRYRLKRFTINVRLLGIDAPEVGRALDSNLNGEKLLERRAGQLSGFLLRSLLLNEKVELIFENICFDTYNRFLAYIVLPTSCICCGSSININRHLIELGLVREYNGRSQRSPWTQTELIKMIRDNIHLVPLEYRNMYNDYV